MAHSNKELSHILEQLDLGSSIAELDKLLETARVETSAFSDLLNDKVDLIPGTKGSGKSALFRIFVDFLPKILFKSRKVVIAHGVQKHGDSVFHAFKDQFEKFTEDQFIDFWCIYFVSLVHEQFLKGDIYSQPLKTADKEIGAFKRACAAAKIPDIEAKKSLSQVLEWIMTIIKSNSPKITYKFPGNAGEIELDLFGEPIEKGVEKETENGRYNLPAYMSSIKDALETLLKRLDLSIWLMVDRLDEIFPRRSTLESTALRALLKTMRLFTSETIRIKIFLRDDMLENLLSVGEGFTALTHITARQADTLRWTEDQILTMVVKRIFANEPIARYLGIDKGRLDASLDYRREVFYKVFSATVHRGANQSPTLRWIYSHTADARGVVTPRDVIDLLTKAKQHQQDIFSSDPSGSSEYIIGPASIQYGLDELSKRKRTTYLEAEFPHLWPDIKKFVGGRTEYSTAALAITLGKKWEAIADDLVSIGLLSKSTRRGQSIYWFPYVYRAGLNLSRGHA